jgi:hypothetical protein
LIAPLSSIWQSLMKLEHMYGKTFFCIISRISFSRNYSTEKSAVQVHISPTLFTNVD